MLVEVGGGVSGALNGAREDSYEAAPGIVFAYQVYAIRPVGGGAGDDDARPQAKVFSSRDAFMTGDGEGVEGGGEEEMELVPVTGEVLEADQDEPTRYEVEAVGEDEFCVSFV